MAVKSGPIDNRSRRSRDSEGSMVRQIRFVLVLGGNGLVVVSALLSLLVYWYYGRRLSEERLASRFTLSVFPRSPTQKGRNKHHLSGIENVKRISCTRLR